MENDIEYIKVFMEYESDDMPMVYFYEVDLKDERLSFWLKTQCIECNLPFVDTTYNRENMIDEFVDRLE